MRFPRVLALALVAPCLASCVAVAAGAAAGYGAAQVARNSDTRSYDAPFPAVWSATVESMREAGLAVEAAAPAGNSGVLTLGGTHVDVWQSSATSTSVRVRVGTFTTAEHRDLSGRLHDGIARRLPTRPQ
jgi:hypothetical protein